MVPLEIASASRIGPIPVSFAPNAWDTGANSKKLRKNMGSEINPGEDAHHIVQSTHEKTEASRQLLDEYQIDINSKENGVGLKPTGDRPAHHEQGLHSYPAIDKVIERLRLAVRGEEDWAKGRQKLIDTLGQIRKEILESSFP